MYIAEFMIDVIYEHKEKQGIDKQTLRNVRCELILIRQNISTASWWRFLRESSIQKITFTYIPHAVNVSIGYVKVIVWKALRKKTWT